MKQFIAITTRIQNNKTVLIVTSKGFSIYNPDGIPFDTALEFLFDLRNLKDKHTVFCSYASSLDYEFLFSSLPVDIKDKLFQSYKVKRQLNNLNYEQETLQDVFYNPDTDVQVKEETDFNLYVNKLAISELLNVDYKGYKIKLINGKLLTITRNKKSITIYDVYGFFRKPLYEMVKVWLNKDVPLIKPDIFAQDIDELKILAQLETKYISLLVTELNNKLIENGINLRSYQGASAISSWLLSKAKAKNEYHNYKHKRHLPAEMYKAMMQSFYAGRAEQLKIGTIEDVKIYDINSAYAYAILDLPIFLHKPLFSNTFQESKFSLWHIEFDFSTLSNDLYFGFLPVRDKRTNGTRYPLKGKGYYWYPEIKFLLENYPDCIDVKYGFYLPDYEPAFFTYAVNALYNTRKQLQEINHPLEKVIKVALSSFYGKFCQHNGKGYYLNYFYAGYITSKTRSMLLEATKGYERNTICFLTDCIHTTADLPLPVSNNIGEYKLKTANTARYIDNGIYQLIKDGRVIKTASKGYKTLDFEKMFGELNDKHFFEAEQKLFVGHNLNAVNPITFKDYLSLLTIEKKESVLADKRFRLRVYEDKPIDLFSGFIDSKPIVGNNKIESGIYKANEYKETDIALDSIFAGKI